MMIINDGDGFNKPFEMTGDVALHGGDFRLADVTTNGHHFYYHGGDIRGISFDGEKHPVVWPDNVHIIHPMPEDSAWYVVHELKPLDKVKAIIELLMARGGSDAVSAWTAVVDLLQADGNEAIDLATFLVGYDAHVGDNLTHAKGLIKAAVIEVAGEEWLNDKTWDEIFTALLNYARGKTRDQMLGLPTETVVEAG
jgi:hypothetical protein